MRTDKLEEGKALVSIIVRTKDRPKLLKKALASISAQTYRPIEVVLVNDGGCNLNVDELGELLGDVSLNYIRLEQNKGRAHAGNVGIQNAKGDYVGFLDDDDEFYPEHVEILAGFLSSHDCNIAYADTEMVCQLYSSEEKKMVDIVTAVFSSDFVYDEMLINNYIPFNSLLFSSHVLSRKGSLDESFDLYEDWDLLIRLAQENQFFHITKTTAKYYQWSSQLQVNQSDAEYTLASHLKVIGKHLHRFTPQVIYRMKKKRDALAVQLDSLRTEERRRSESIAQLEADINDKDRRLSVIEGLIREKDEQIRNQEESIAERDKEILTINDCIAQLGDHISRQEALIGEKEEHIVRLVRDLDAIRNTRGWKLLEGVRRAKKVILPLSSAHAEAWRLVSKSARILRREGPVAFVKKAKRKAIDGATISSLSSSVSHLALTDEFRERFQSPRAFRVLFVKWEWAGITNHYRIDNMAEYLRIGRADAEVIDLEALPRNIPHVYEFDLVIIHRIPMHPMLREFIEACKMRKIIVIFDIDDYLFEASVVQEIEWVKHTNPAERERLIEHMKQCRQTLEACDYFIAPTDFLAKKAEELGKKAYVVRNGFSRELFRKFYEKGEVASAAGEPPVIRIGYFSGTNTHQKDFQSIAPAILRILREFAHTRLYICGLLDLDDSFSPYGHKIERVPLVPLDGMPEAMAPCTINIAPLEPGNIFCEAKSELKYMYAGILGMPTVASPSDAFRHAIRNGENGFLASAPDEWYEYLKKLVEDPDLRAAMGRQARRHVVAEYSPEVLSVRVHEVYRDAIADARRKRNVPERSISVGIVVADSVDNGGNYRHVMAVAEALTARGHHVDCYYYDGKGSNGVGGPVGVNHIEHVMSCDVLVCTDSHNSSVSVYRHRDRTARLVYLSAAQSEEIPYPWGALFQVIPYSSDAGRIAGLLENLAWEIADRAKS